MNLLQRGGRLPNAKGYRCTTTGEYAPLDKWAKKISAELGLQESTIKNQICRAARLCKPWRGLRFERVEYRR